MDHIGVLILLPSCSLIFILISHDVESEHCE